MIALIPLRAGSKGIPNKNITFIAGYPLFYWAINAAFRSKIFDDIWVSTEDESIKQMVMRYFPDIKVHDRPPELAEDEVSTEDVMLDFVKHVDSDVLCLIQATSPLLTAEDLVGGYGKHKTCDTIISVAKDTSFYWVNERTPINYKPRERTTRQKTKPLYRENGSFYFMRTGILKEEKCRIGGITEFYIMKDSLEIDESDDLTMAESLLLHRNKIKALIFDVDGTMTDGGMYYGINSEAFKKFNTKDAQGLQNLDLIVEAFTGEDSMCTKARMRKLGITLTTTDNKVRSLHVFCKVHNISLHEIAYIGDDKNDVEAMKLVGLSACPNDAQNCVKFADIICQNNGGNGAVREFCDYLGG